MTATIYPGIKASWNALAERLRLPVARAMTQKRARALCCRMVDPQWAADWLKALNHIETCPFLLGRNGRGWRANFDFFLRPDTVTKILEGAYDDARTARSGAGGSARIASAPAEYAEVGKRVDV